ncbi:MAG: hypothetical protein ACT4QG_15485 [Sporichthyaceae bacterium]
MAKKPPRKSPWQRPTTWAAAALVVALAAGGGAWYGTRGDDSAASVVKDEPQSPADQWQNQVTTGLAGASQGTLDYLKVVYDWSEGKTTNEAMAQAADQAFGRYMEARDFLAKQAAFGPAPRALDNFKDTFEIYADTARLAKLGSGVESDDLRKQIQFQIQRLRQIADRYYDLAKSDLDQFRGRDPIGQHIEFTRVPEVPVFDGIEAGKPLASPAPTVAAREYQEQRPEQAFEAWLSTVKSANIPTGKAVLDAIPQGNGAALGGLAVALARASNTLYDSSDPKGERTLNTRIQLGLLLQAEALRTAQIAALAAKDERPIAIQISEALGFVGNRAWDPRLGERTTDLTDRVLERKPI